MIKKFTSLLCTLCLIYTSLCITQAPYASAKELGADPYSPYEWKPIAIGGGGVISDYIFHPKVEGLVITRGDVGGAWIREPGEKRWTSMSNFPWDQSNYMGCDGIAWDPNDPDVIYWAGGQYRWTSQRGTVFKSTDRGKTWQKTGFAGIGGFGSDNGNKSGDTIRVDPANSNIVYVGTYDGKGLYRSGNAGKTFEKVDSLPFTADTRYMRFFAFDPNSVKDGATQRIYTHVSSQGIYVTEDGSKTWTLVEGYQGSDCHGLSISNDGTLVAAASNGCFKYSGGQWTTISDLPDGKYRGIAIAPTDSSFIVAVRTNHCNIMRCPILLSQDGGKTWVNTAEDIIRTETAGYLDDDTFSSSAIFVRMDPHNHKHVVIGDWYGAWHTPDITAKPKVAWSDDTIGEEELCVLNLISHKDNPYRLLISAMDQDGIPVVDLDSPQPRKFTDMFADHGGQRMLTTAGLDVCYGDANFVIRTGVSHFAEDDSRANYSLDGGNTWHIFENNPLRGHTSRLGSSAKFSSNINEETGKPAHIVVMRSGKKGVVSHDFGETWNEIEDLPTNLTWGYNSSKQMLEKDCTQDDTFYFYDWTKGVFYRSTDGGDSWDKKFELPSRPSTEGFPRMVSIPGSPGEVWFATGASAPHLVAGTLYRTTDGFESLDPVAGFSSVLTVGYGKAAPGRENPAIYVAGKRNDLMGIYRSVNGGKNWELITDENVPGGFWKDTKYLCGDMKDFGVVYVAGAGAGAFYGKPEGTKLTPLSMNSEESKIISEISLSVNGKVATCKDVHQENGVIYYPARALYELLGADVSWKADTGTVDIKREIFDVNIYGRFADGGKVIQKLSLTPGSNVVKINEENRNLNNNVMNIGGTVYVPLREALALWNLELNNPNDDVYMITDKSILVSDYFFRKLN